MRQCPGSDLRLRVIDFDKTFVTSWEQRLVHSHSQRYGWLHSVRDFSRLLSPVLVEGG